MAWRVKPYFTLPEGFELWEDVDVLELRYKGECVGMFNPHTATRESILRSCHEHTSNNIIQGIIKEDLE